MLLQSSVDPLRWADAMIIISDDIRLAFSAERSVKGDEVAWWRAVANIRMKAVVLRSLISIICLNRSPRFKLSK